jgi:hypothetical protein
MCAQDTSERLLVRRLPASYFYSHAHCANYLPADVACDHVAIENRRRTDPDFDDQLIGALRRQFAFAVAT